MLPQVKKVIDATTLQLDRGQIVRLIGVDCPAIDTKAGKQAYEFTKRLAEGKDVHLEFDVENTDSNGRLLVYLYIKEYIPPTTKIAFAPIEGVIERVIKQGKIYIKTFVNAYLVLEGYAQPEASPPNIKYAALFQELHQRAKGAQ